MPAIRPISDLRNNFNEISDLCHSLRGPVFITKNGIGDMVIMSVEVYERIESKLELYSKLAEAEAEIASGAEGANLYEFAKRLRDNVHGNI